MTDAFVVRWGATVPGREAKALEVFSRSIERFDQLAKEGRVHGHQEYIALTGRAGGFSIVTGELEELQRVLLEPETLALNSQAEAIVEDFELNLYGGGSDRAIQDLMGTYVGALSDIGYM